MTTGPDLRAERERAGVSLTALARAMGKDFVTIWRWEGMAIVPDKKAQLYRDSLAEMVAQGDAA